MVQRYKATITGIVQGIGFRPFIYNLAVSTNLRGYVRNNSRGVILEVEGEPTQIDLFFNRLENHSLPLAQITSIQKISLPPQNYPDFHIERSDVLSERNTLIAPDICVCEHCLREMSNPADRRFRYPFINCTNCGPRYTIIEDVPYDRPYTAMKTFQMCDNCLQEYHDPTNRRFHAQPNGCAKCGPELQLFDNNKQRIENGDPVFQAVKFLKAGKILAIKGLGGFHLAVDATNSLAVRQLRIRKNREEKPLALMSLNPEKIKKYALVTPEEAALLHTPQRPIVLLKKKLPNTIAHEVAPGNHNFGVMLPYTPLHYLLFDSDFLALVMTSANISEEPIVIENSDAFSRLASIADYFLIHNRDIFLRSDDSVMRILNQKPVQLRRSRGFVPQPIFLKNASPQILACGAELKNTICLTKGKHAFLSQHIGDLKNPASYDFFELTIQHLKRILDIKPEIIAYDLHPNYLCTRYAREQRHLQQIGIQHHHAHIMSCITENDIEGPVIGLSFDGTGYGTDGKIWGGEVLLVNGAKFTRMAHPEYVAMPGGEKAITEPWRMALSYLYKTFGDDFINIDLPLIRQLNPDTLYIILRMLKSGFNSPETSSLGRLFDGVAAILNICTRVTYEGQAAISLEMIADSNMPVNPYPFEWTKNDNSYQIPTASIIESIVHDLHDKKTMCEISTKFHCTLITLFTELCLQLKTETGLDRVVCSGGVFQNAILTRGLSQKLKQEKFKIYFHSKVPPNDGGIALGQAAIAMKKYNS